MLNNPPPPLPSRTPTHHNQYRSALGITVAFPNFWSRHHPIEDDGLCHLLYQYLQRSLKGCEQKLSSIYLPETIVFEHNFPRVWYYYDKDSEAISKRPSRMLDVQSMFRFFGVPIKNIDVVAQFFYATVPIGEAWDAILSRRAKEQNSTLLSQGLTYVEFFTVEGLKDFLLQQHRKPDGVLQRFVLPKGDGSSRKNNQIQVFWSPLMTSVYRRTNYHRLDDRMVPIPARLSTYDGPAYYSYESMVADDTKVCLTGLCEDIVRHFYQVEKKQITRMVLYFKIDDNNRVWLLWCSSVRVEPDSFNPSTLRVPPLLDQRTEVLNNESSTVARLQARRHRQKHLLELDSHLFEATRDIEFALNINASHRRQAKVLGMPGMANAAPKKGSKNPCYDTNHPLHEAFVALCDEKDGPFVAAINEHLNELDRPNSKSSKSYRNSSINNSAMERGSIDEISQKMTDPRDVVLEELVALAMDAWHAVYSATLSTTTMKAPITRVVLAEPLVSALSTEELQTLVNLLGLRSVDASASTQHYEVSPLLVDPGRRLDQTSLQVEKEVSNFFKTLFDHRGDEITRLCMDQYGEQF
ncbi:unnamed protein product [Phytomonas sp. EM1]|nr:unnamed protein product [Phytomonas sp. EM1]|eukprot:CCW61764.1 unnamed protein product [Phytomonas sp. isolate EM1]